MLSKRQAGVTMMELMVVVLIAAILAATAAPSFSSFVQNTRLTSTMSQLTSDLNRARSEAIKRNVRVLICVRNVAGTDCVAGTNWQNGWLACYDGDQNGACDLSTTAEPNPIVVRPPVNARLTLAGSGNATTPIQFNPNGTQGAGAANATLALCCKSNVTSASSAVIAATGHISRP